MTNQFRLRLAEALALTVLPCVVLWCGAAVAGGNVTWSDQFYAPGLANADEGYALTVFESKLIVGGAFEHVDGMSARCIARWDGSNWSPLGGGLDSNAYAFAVFNNELIAGTKGDDEPDTWTIVKWDGANWHRLGSGINGSVHALAVYDGKLIAGGEFDTAGGVGAISIAAWNGTSWSALGSGMQGGGYPSVRALGIYDGKLIAGGQFEIAGGVSTTNIAAWNGTSWSALGSGVGIEDNYDYISTLTVSNGLLIVGGSFDLAGGVTARNIAAWNGTTWSSLGAGTNKQIEALTLYAGVLVAGGSFDSAGAVQANNIARWDGASWHALGTGMNREVGALVAYGGSLIAEGGFTVAGGKVANGIASWNGSEWNAVSSRAGKGLGVGYHSYEVKSFCIHENELIVGGYFATVGNLVVNNIACWTGTQWHPLGSGAGAGRRTPEPEILADYNGDLVAVGDSGVTDYIARWNGVDWDTLGGRTNYEQGISTLASFDGQLIAGGHFDTIDGVNANNIAAWNGSSWSAVGSGIGGNYPSVNALCIYNGQLIAGGEFDSAGGMSASNIARWDGLNWYPIGSGIDGGVHALTVYKGQLVAAGDFTFAGGVSANGIARWDGSLWLPLPGGPGMGITDLTVYDDHLIAGGYFNRNDGASFDYIAGWDGIGWEVLGSGVYGGDVKALQVFKDSLYVGGGFLSADGQPSARIAKLWIDPVGVPMDEGGVVPENFVLHQNHPNPFNASTTIRFSLKTGGTAELGIYNILGQLISVYRESNLQPGTYSFEWDGRDQAGIEIPGGVYLYRLTSGAFSETRKMTVLK